jgi:hypothetical protein
MAERSNDLTPSTPPLAELTELYRRATENNWEIVKSTTAQAINRLAASQAAAAEASALHRFASEMG